MVKAEGPEIRAPRAGDFLSYVKEPVLQLMFLP